MNSVMGYFDAFGCVVQATQYDGTAQHACELQLWIEGGTMPEGDSTADGRNETSLFIYGGCYEALPTDWIIETLEGDWYIFEDAEFQNAFEWVGEAI